MQQNTPLTFLSNGEEMSERIRSFDWACTPLGTPETWSPALRTTLRILLANRFPHILWWGPHYIQFYNDPYTPIPGDKHPHRALGRPASECWSEIWHVIGPLIDTPFNGGPPTWNEDIFLEVQRHGFVEETHFTIAYSPVPDDTVPGGIGGVLATVHEITEKIIGERRVRALRDLGAMAAGAKTAEEACTRAADILSRHAMDIPFALLYVLDDDGKRARLAGTAGVASGMAVSPEVLDCAAATALTTPAFAWPIADVLRTRAAATVDDVNVRFGGDVPPGPWTDPPHQAVLVPIRSTMAHRIAGVLVAGVSSRLRLDDRYLSFYDLVAGQIGSAIAGARAYDEERRRAEALAEIDRAKTTFFSNVSHEFRTPLTLMLGPIEDLLERADDALSPAAREHVELAHRNSLRLLKLVNTLLDFSRIEAGRVQASYEPTDLAMFTSDLASVFRSAVERAGLRLTIDCAPPGEDVFVDREMWEKVVLNLLSNAFKFTFVGEIEVRLRRAGAHVECSVRDTGTGIEAAELPHVFERFHRVRGARGRTFEGSGIGLALVRELVRLHGGAVRVESEVDRGSCFTVSIPLGKAHLPADRIGGTRALASTAIQSEVYLEEALRWLPNQDGTAPRDVIGITQWTPATEPAVSSDAAAPRPPRPPRPRILLADDNADMREYVGRLLRAEYEVEAVGDGAAALAAARAQTPPFDLILTDVMMPELDGMALLAAVRNDERLETTPVILLSARAGEEARVDAMNAGANDYLIKPFSAKELLARVRANVEMARLRRESERQLRESDARFRTLANTAPTMLWVTGPDGSWSFVSRGWCEFTGLSEAQSLGVGWLDALHSDDRGDASRVFISANSARGEFSNDYRVRRHDGQDRWTLFAGRPRFAADGGFLGYVGSVIDIHERRMAEMALRETDRRKDEFLATLAHELRNPLAPLRYSLHLLREVAPHDGFSAPLHDMMERQVNHLARLVDDLLEVSRITRGTLELRKEWVELSAIVRNAIETSDPLVQSSSRRLRVSLPIDPIVLEGDPVRLAQVLANLLNNAAQYTAEGGEITVHARRLDDAVCMSVRDDGIGIAPEQLPHIFEMFSRGHHRISSHGGLGIGLALARRLVEMHGGSLEAASGGLGKGSEFTVRLPVVAAPAARPGGPTTDDHSAIPQRVLVVEDNPDAADSLAGVLQLFGAEVRIAYDGIQALELFRTFQPSLILLDLGLPHMDGFEIARRVRAEECGRRPVIVAVTGWGQESDRSRTSSEGFDQHLVKPVEPRFLRQILTSIAARQIST